MIPTVILAGGMATRLYPKTLTIPKSLIKIAGKPFIHYQLTLLKKQGVNNIILCVSKFGDMIQEYVGDGSKWGLNVKYSYDGDTLLGTGGAVKKALPLLPDEFMVMYGDSYLNVDLKSIVKWFEHQGKQGLMTVYRNENRWGKSNVLFKNWQIMKYDKKNPTPEMKHIDYGISILKKEALNGWDGVFDLSDVFVELIENGEMSGFEVFERFYEIGDFEGIKEFEKYLKNKQK